VRGQLPLITVEGMSSRHLEELARDIVSLLHCDNYEEGSVVWWALMIASAAVNEEVNRRITRPAR
jgi:hypothetical protein